MNGVLEGIERVIVESKDGELIATITEDEINCDPEYQVRLKPVIPEHKLFISCPMKGRTEENIKKSFEVLKRTAEADYFITFENYFDYRGCSVENQVAALYGLKRVLAMTKLAAPDVLDKGPSIPTCDG